MASDECETSGHCIAPYDPAPDEGEAMRGPAACVDACIEEDDLLRWCLDDDACCGDLRCNEVDGFCEAPLSADGTTEVPATGTGSGSSGDTGSGSGSSGSSGSGSETGSSSGAGSDSGSSSSG